MKPYIYLIILLASAIWLPGCKTSKNVDSDKQIDYTGELSQMQRLIDSLTIAINMQGKEITERLSNLNVEHKTVYYSDPDSTGKQYPVIVSETTANREDKENTETYIEMNATLTELRDKLSSMESRLDGLIKEQQKLSEISWWNLHKWEVFFFVVILVVVGVLVYKLRK